LVARVWLIPDRENSGGGELGMIHFRLGGQGQSQASRELPNEEVLSMRGMRTKKRGTRGDQREVGNTDFFLL